MLRRPALDKVRCPSTFSGVRAIIQRVSEAAVRINGHAHSAIGPGMLVLLGIEAADNADDVQWLSGKIARLRIFNDAEGLMNLSLNEIAGEILVISQFTLFASTKKGNRPSFVQAARPEIAIPLYEQFLARLASDAGREVKSGVFAADMKVSLVNDGPVTIFIDSKNRE